MQTLVTLAKQSLDGSYFYYAAWVVLMYDHLSMLDMEVELIWVRILKNDGHWSKFFFIINRYIPDVSFIYGVALMTWLPDDVFSKQCPHLSRVQTWMSLIALQAMQRYLPLLYYVFVPFYLTSLTPPAIMVHRIICMYRYKRILTIYIVTGFVCNLLAGFIIAGNSMHVMNTPIFFGRHLADVCATQLPRLGRWQSWFLMLAFEIVVFSLAAFEGVRFFRESKFSRDLNIVTRGRKGHSLMYILMRDSIVFPLIGLLLSFINILAFYVFPMSAMQYTFTTTAALTPILGCRLILHLRDAYYQPFSDEIEAFQEPIAPDSRHIDADSAPVYALDTMASSSTLPPRRHLFTD
ncbi:hypothetical protein FA13DRAFT_1805969 [Coprinellus micaceus]|uniref:DUF6533 domain-containing protein n=1 Tax=Coprinellus micaceus TaxID=71717 RepID=A0A4Y7RTG6_COPMI|nr:hypothetical protein FA13DRAFT_1805969 [Coprinellus micaceus]